MQFKHYDIGDDGKTPLDNTAVIKCVIVSHNAPKLLRSCLTSRVIALDRSLFHYILPRKSDLSKSVGK